MEAWFYRLAETPPWVWIALVLVWFIFYAVQSAAGRICSLLREIQVDVQDLRAELVDRPAKQRLRGRFYAAGMPPEDIPGEP